MVRLKPSRQALLLSYLASVLCLTANTRANDGPATAPNFTHRLILEEPNGGTDSAVSADGKWLAFSTRRSGNLDVWVRNIETGQERQVTTNPATDNEARWSPDGKQLCFVTQRSGSQDVYVLDLETGREMPIATGAFNEDYPSFSQDGTEIVFTGGPRGFREVQVYSLATGKIRTVTRGFGYVGSANFSPDGKQIVFHAYYDNNYNSGKADVYVVPATGGEVRNITDEGTVWNYKPCWSWDGDWITYSSKRSSKNFNLWVIRPDGSDRRAVTNVNGPDLRWSNWTRDGRLGWHQINPQTGRVRAVDIASGAIADLHTSDFHVRDLSASPDGRQILFESDFRIYLLDARPGAEPREVATGLAPRWSRDGKSISYLVERRSKIAVQALDGGEPRLLDVKPAAWPEISGNGWSPDGKTLAVVAASGERHQIQLISPDGATRTLVDNPEHKSAPTWSPDGRYLFFAENHPSSVGYYISSGPVMAAASSPAASPKSAGQLPQRIGPLDGAAAGGRNPALAFTHSDSLVTAPAFELSNVHGERVRLADLKSDATLLYFWSTSRECETDLQALAALKNRFADRGVTVLTLAFGSGTAEDVRRFLDTAGADVPTLMCTSRVCDDYGVAIFPTAFVLDRNHNVRYWKYGSQLADHWEQLVEEVLHAGAEEAD